MPAQPEPLHDATAERHRTLRAVAELLRALSPAVLVLEDLHWTDERTVELLALLASRRDTALSVVISYRPADVERGSALVTTLSSLPARLVEHIGVAPLQAHSVGALAAQLLGGGQVAPELEARLAERSGGLPYVVEQDVRLLRERNALLERDGWWHEAPQIADALPASVGDPVVERAARLSAPARRALEVIAVLAAPAREQVVAAVAGLDDAAVVDGLSEALAAGCSTIAAISSTSATRSRAPRSTRRFPGPSGGVCTARSRSTSSRTALQGPRIARVPPRGRRRRGGVGARDRGRRRSRPHARRRREGLWLLPGAAAGRGARCRSPRERDAEALLGLVAERPR